MGHCTSSHLTGCEKLTVSVPPPKVQEAFIGIFNNPSKYLLFGNSILTISPMTVTGSIYPDLSIVIVGPPL